ncbi:MAG TPA: amino acid adenylation domain-containing protein, partial [Thermoanaerobaculia bacterium]
MGREWNGTEIAVVGMAGRFPGAASTETLWRNLKDGDEAIRRLSDEELDALGVDAALRAAPGYVPAVSQMAGFADFDAAFFGINHREAETMDPQQRVFLECAWEALEDAGYDGAAFPGLVGVFAGATLSTYLLVNLARNQRVASGTDPQQLIIGNAGDALTTRVSYKLNLRGPSQAVQCACSTSLVAVHLACQSLLNEECDMALAGGVSINVTHLGGYRSLPGSILSPDGRCRAYDARAEGSVFGSGAGIVVLKRLEDALAEGDTIRAVILGSATNNDGAFKVGFTAPSVEGQSRVISEALAVAGIDPETVAYVEGHGSGTALGDPIEVQAVTRAFRAYTEKRGFCGIGSIKSNLGHLDVAAGVAGLIKAVLALEHGQIPPTVSFETPNPKIDFAASPVYVVDRLTEWPASSRPRRAGVNSFGLGGTTAHVVLEEAPAPAPAGEPRPWQLLALSARSAAALEAAHGGLSRHLETHPELHLEDVAHTLHAGRRRFPHRRALVCRLPEGGALGGATVVPERILEGVGEATERPVVFLFPGLGDHYAGMGRGLYRGEKVFRDAVDECSRLLDSHLGRDLRELLFPGGEEETDGGGAELDLRRMLGRGREAARSDADKALDATIYAQPATFVVEYALARLWLSWGVEPAAMIGYSLGEYVAACVAGVLPLADALAVVARRAKLIQDLPPGAMLAVPRPPGDWIPGELDVAALNAPDQCVVAGPEAAVAAFAAALAGEGEAARRLPTSHAFHSRHMAAAAAAFAEVVRGVRLQAPKVPFLTNVTGTWITDAEATDPEHWVRHMVGTVRFAEGVAELCREPRRILLEVGPGQTLGSLVKLHPGYHGDQPVVASLPGSFSRRGDLPFMLGAAGQLWIDGARFDWEGFYAGRRRRRVPLPTYPFERRRYWVEGNGSAAAIPSAATLPAASADVASGGAALYARPELASDYEPPQGEIEERVAELWREVLGVDQVGRRDDFFELDGHSLLATQVASRLREVYGVEVTIRQVLAEPTVAGMAAAVAAVRAGSGRRPVRAVEIRPRPRRDEPAPASFAQERMWFLGQLDPDAHAYNIFFNVRLEGPLDPGVLRHALREVSRRHEVLRTTFVAVEGKPCQVVGGELAEMPVVDLGGLEAAARERVAARLAAAEHHRPFELARGPLFRLALLRCGEAEHVLLVNMHHVVSDGWSVGILLTEAAAIYQALLRREASPLPELPIQYADFAVWQREWLRGQVLAAELGYWKEALADPPPPLRLPADRPRRRGAGFLETTEELLLTPRLTAELGALGRRHAATPFITLLAAFETLLHRYTGERDMVVGTPIADRNHQAIEGLIGYFLNTLALRGRPAPELSFVGFLERTRQVALAGYDHQDLPLERVMTALQQDGFGGAELFQVMFLYQNVPLPSMEVGPLRLSLAEVGGAAVLDTAIYDLSLIMDEIGPGGPDADLRVAMVANGRLFERATVARFAGHFRNLLQAIVEDPERKLEELPLMSPEEHHQLAMARGLKGPGRIHQVFARQAALTPGSPAVIGEQGVLTYAELEARSNQLAHRLRALGVGPEVVVGIFIERRHEMLVALLGVLKAGGAYVPLDPVFPEERKAYVLEQVKAPVVLSSAALAPKLPPTGATVLRVDADWDAVAAFPATPPSSLAGTDNAAYLIFTSGSTGRPKGVVITHAALLAYVWAARRVYEIEAHDRVLQFASLSFDNSVEEIFPVLTCGGAVVLRTEAMLGSAAALLDRCREQGVTILNLPTTFWNGLGAALAREELVLGRPVRLVIIGGERLDPDRLPGFRRQCAPGVRIFNTYGPTETTVCSNAHEVTGPPPGGVEEAPIGRTLPGVAGHVLDRRGRLVPYGVAGELVLGGPGLARGYLNAPRQTAERFVPDPFGPPSERLYRSGDLVRQRADGVALFLDRVDHQVKVRGFRIELGEIETVLAGHPAITHAAVLARGEDADRRLIAYVVAEDDTTESELREYLGQRLPDYMVPAFFVFLDVLPLTASNKLNRRALPEPDAGRRAIETPFAAPRSDAEKLLAEVFAKLLEVERVGVNDSFFELGGHSLMLPQVIHRLRQALHVEVPLRTLYDEPTVARLAVVVEDLILDQIESLEEPPRRAAAPDEPHLARIFETGVALDPAAEALVWQHERLTYDELDRQANRLARALRRLGVGPETIVALHLRRRPELLVAVLATLKAGGAYVSLDPSYPSGRTALIFEDAEPVLVLVDAGARPPAAAAAVLAVEDVLAAAAGEDENRLEPASGGDDLAYLIYTSGSTGRPKGVAIAHRNAANLVRWAGAALPADELACMLAATSLNFDLSVFELFVPWSRGGKVVLASNALELPDLPAAAEVTFVNTVPSAMAELVR